MSALIHLVAGLIVLARLYVPIGATVIAGWPVRLALFALWWLATLRGPANRRRRFLSSLHNQRGELASYAAWIAVLVLFWVSQDGEHQLTSYLVSAYIGTIPFYLLGTYYSVFERDGPRMALAMALVVGASSLQALPAVWQDPGLVRLGAIDLTPETRSLGIGSYAELTGFAIALPFLLTTSLGAKHVWRILGVVACSAIAALSLIATFSGTILLTVLGLSGCAVFYVLLGGIRRNRLIAGAAAIASASILATVMLPRLYEVPEIGSRYERLADTFSNLPDILARRTADPTYRYELMIQSFGVFIEHPAIGVALEAKGVGTEGTGGHSSWVDALANYGVLGGFPYLLFHLLVLRRLWRAWNAERSNALTWGCLLSCLLYLFYGFFNVTTQGATVALFLFIAGAGGHKPRSMARRDQCVVSRAPVRR